MRRGIHTSVTVVALVLTWHVHVVQAAPKPVIGFAVDPGFGPETLLTTDPETNGQALAWVRTSDGWYATTGATCTSASGSEEGASGETPPASDVDALSGLKFTQFSGNGGGDADFDLGVTITDDDVGIVIGEVGTADQDGDWETIIPLSGGVPVGSWQRGIDSDDYGPQSRGWEVVGGNIFHARLTTLRHSDFTNDTGALSFDGIRLGGNGLCDPNIVATIATLVPDYSPATPSVLPVTNMTFSPGFTASPETNGQTLTSIATSEGVFDNITGLTCTAYDLRTGIFRAENEPPPASTYEALSGLRFTQFGANANVIDYALGQTIGQGNRRVRFFVSECQALDTLDLISVYPTSSGRLINEWRVDITPTTYGPASDQWKTDIGTKSYKGCIASFGITDFTNGVPGTLADVDGFRVDGFSHAEVGVFGFYELPPSGTVVSVR